MQVSYEDILQEYEPFKVYNADKTRFFYYMLPLKMLDLNEQQRRDGKLSKKWVGHRLVLQ